MSAGSNHASLRLLADIGGTNARFALQAADGAAGVRFADIEVLACADYASLDAAIADYLARAGGRGHAVAGIRHAAIAIATPVEGDQVGMTNHHWRFSIEACAPAAASTRWSWSTISPRWRSRCRTWIRMGACASATAAMARQAARSA